MYVCTLILGEQFEPDALTYCLKILMHQGRRGNIKQNAKKPEELLPEVFVYVIVY